MIPAEAQTHTCRIVYSSGRVAYVEGYTYADIARLRASWAEITDPPSTATIEIVEAER